MINNMAYCKSFFNGFEVVIQDFYESYHDGKVCRYAKCYIPALGICEGILLSDIYVKEV